MTLVLSIVLYLLAGLAFMVSVYSKTWPSTKGRLITACVESDRSGGQYSESSSVLYEFVVGNRTYRSSLIRASGDFSWSTTMPGMSSANAQIDEIINRGDPIVYYCPIFPRFAYLQPGGFVSSVFLLIIATLCLIISAHW